MSLRKFDYTDYPKTSTCVIVGVPAIIVIGCVVWYAWYQAGMQVRIYERQGIRMTQWEIGRAHV